MVDDRTRDGKNGFPIAINLEGGTIVFDLPTPGILGGLDPETVGLLVVDGLGIIRKLWGLAEKLPHLRLEQPLQDTLVGAVLDTGPDSLGGALYYEGYRYFAGRLENGGPDDRLVLVTSAREESRVRRLASKSTQMASTLKRLGKALKMNQSLRELCIASAHEIASAMELAAVLIWTAEPEDPALKLAASVGVNRLGISTLTHLRTTGGTGCAAEMVADSGKFFHVGNVVDHILTTHLEAKFCYLKPGGVTVYPLVISGRLLGVLEMVGREGDPQFAECAELHETVAEHLALALNSAAMFENLERLASHDPLTGLANHRALQEFLHQRATEAERTSQHLGVIMIDVDHFRSFNEEEGHDAGDAVLRLVADAIKSCLRSYDLGARYGGEEFTVVLPGTTDAGLLAAAERIRIKVESVPFETRSGRERHLTVSVGCALLPENGNDGPTLLKAADLALYEAKRAGRNRVVRYQGLVSSDAPLPPLELAGVLELMSDQERLQGVNRVDRLNPEMVWLSERLHLSPSQQTILEALLMTVPAYLDAVESGDIITINRFETANDARVLLPSLHALSARSDVTHFPLLAKVVQVLLALDQDGGRALAEEPAKYDPEILSLVWEYSSAA